MFRSEYTNQRQLAVRMLSGILLRRECVVCLEPYSELFVRGGQPPHCGDQQSIYNEVGRRSGIFGKASTCFEKIVHRLSKKEFFVINQIGCDKSITPPIDCSTTINNRSQSDRIRRIVGRVLVNLLCAPDLPVDLPTLLVWPLAIIGSSQKAIGSSSLFNGTASKLALLSCLQLYLFSPIETTVANSLKASLLWSYAGTPGLPTPHHLRSLSLLYEEYTYECQQKVDDCLRNFNDQDDRDVQGSEVNSSALSQSNFNVREVFALKCRWGRVDQIVANNDEYQVVSWLTQQVMVCLNVLVSNNKMQPQLEATCRLGLQSLHSVAALIEQGSENTVACIRHKFLACFFTAFKFLLDESTMKRNAYVYEVEIACWALLAALALKDEFTVNYLLVVHSEWVRGTVIRYLHAHWFMCINKHRGSQSTEGDIYSSDEIINTMIMRLLKHCLAYGLGLRCCSDLLLAINVKYLQDSNLSDFHSTNDSNHDIPVDFFVLLEQAVRTASAWLLSDKSDPINNSGSDRRSHLEDAIEFSSSILSFASKHWTYFEHVLTQRIETNDEADSRNKIDERPLVAQASVLNLLCSLFISNCPVAASNDQNLERFLPTKTMPELSSIESMMLRLDYDLVRKINGSLRLWGCGLISAVLVHVERIHLTQDEVAASSSRSIDAALEHVRGQCIHMMAMSRSGYFMHPQSAIDYVDAMIKVVSSFRKEIEFDLNWKVIECVLVWQRYLSVSALTNIYDLQSDITTLAPAEVSFAFITSIKESTQRCCSLMRNCSSQRSESSTLTTPNKGRLGSVSRGLINWHLQRLLDSSILLAIIFKTNTLAMLHILNDVSGRTSPRLIASLTVELKSSISDSLYSLTSHTFSGPKTSLFLWFMQDLITVSLLKDQVHRHGSIATHDYLTIKEQTDLLSTSVIDYITTTDKYFQSGDNHKLSTLSHDALQYFNCLSGSSLKLQDHSLSYNKPLVISLDHMWPFKVLIKLPRKQMQQWLIVLTNQKDACLLDVPHMDAEFRMDAIASAQFYLLQLCVTDQHEKWLSNTNPSESHQIVEMIIEDVNDEVYINYRNLMCNLSLQAMHYSSLLPRHTFAYSFCRKAQDKFFSTTGMMMKSRVPNSRSSAGSNAVSSREGALDLSIKVIEASVNQIIAYELHAVALLTLISPMMPWVVRQRVWTEIGSLRLVHLMSYDEYLIPLLPIHFMSTTYNSHIITGDVTTTEDSPPSMSISNPCESISLYTDIARALSRLRSPLDRRLSIVAIAVFQISRFIFNSIRIDPYHPTIIKGSARQLLLSIKQIISCDEYSKAQSLWLLSAIIQAAEIVHSMISMLSPISADTSSDGDSPNVFVSILERMKRVISTADTRPEGELKVLDAHGLIINVSCDQIFLDLNQSGASMLSLSDVLLTAAM